MLNRDLTEAQAEEVAQALLEEGPYDDELITFDEINDMVASKIHEQASQEDIEKAVSYTHLDVYKRQARCRSR